MDLLSHTFQVYIETLDRHACILAIKATYEIIDQQNIDSDSELVLDPNLNDSDPITRLESAFARACCHAYRLCGFARLQSNLEEGLRPNLHIDPRISMQIRDYSIELTTHYKIWTEDDRDMLIDTTAYEHIHPVSGLEVEIEHDTRVDNKIDNEIEIDNRITALVEWNDAPGFSKTTRPFRFKATSNDMYVCDYDLVVEFSVNEPFFEEELRALVDDLILFYNITLRMQLFEDIVERCEHEDLDKPSRSSCLRHHKTINTFNYKVRVHPDTKRLA